MKHKYEIGDTVYIQSRYDGIVKRYIVSKTEVESDDELVPAYELDKLVQFNKDGHSFGSSKPQLEPVYDMDGKTIMWNMNYLPAPEYVLMQIGDPIVSTFWVNFGEISDEILTESMINVKD